MDGSNPPAPRRRPTDGGYARGEETREKIVEAAFRVFAEEGYGGASTRRIAAEAGVNPPALQYYFDSKEGLHRACGQLIVDRVTKELHPLFDHAEAALSDGGREAAIEALCDLTQKLALMAMAKAEAESENWSRFLNRCQTDNAGPGSTAIQDGIVDPIKQIAIRLVASAMNLPTNLADTRLRAILLLSQLSAFHSNRASTLSTLGWEDFTGENLDVALEVLRDHVKRVVA